MRRTKIELDEKSIGELKNVVKKGQRAVREVNRARILLLSNAGWRNDKIAETLCVSRNTVLGVNKRYIKGGLEMALHDRTRSGQPKKYGEKETAEIITLVCSSPPEGRKRWSIRLIVEEMKKRKGFEGINRESVRLILKKMTQRHGREECGVSRQ